jgi:hypothetical protein
MPISNFTPRLVDARLVLPRQHCRLNYHAAGFAQTGVRQIPDQSHSSIRFHWLNAGSGAAANKVGYLGEVGDFGERRTLARMVRLVSGNRNPNGHAGQGS